MGKLFSRDMILYASATVVACAAIFVLPFYFPPSTYAKSASYVYGFNNSIAAAALLMAIGLFAMIGARSDPASEARLLSAFAPETGVRGEGIRPWAAWLGVAAWTSSTLYLYFVTKGSHYGEMTYHIRGQVPPDPDQLKDNTVASAT
jgi:hypothetical protein